MKEKSFIILFLKFSFSFVLFLFLICHTFDIYGINGNISFVNILYFIVSVISTLIIVFFIVFSNCLKSGDDCIKIIGLNIVALSLKYVLPKIGELIPFSYNLKSYDDIGLISLIILSCLFIMVWSVILLIDDSPITHTQVYDNRKKKFY
mgnify:CR=1 FL=1